MTSRCRSTDGPAERAGGSATVRTPATRARSGDITSQRLDPVSFNLSFQYSTLRSPPASPAGDDHVSSALGANVAESFVANPGDFVDPANWEVDGAALPSLPALTPRSSTRRLVARRRLAASA